MRRPLLLAAAIAAVAFTAPAEAKPFSYADAKGDIPVAGVDIVSVSYATEGNTTTKRVGSRAVKTYEPTRLLVTLNLAAAPVEQPGIKYKVEAEIEGCGVFSATYAPGTVYARQLSGPASLFLGCGGSDPLTDNSLLIFPKYEVSGSKIVWSIPLKTLPKEARAGAHYSAHNASVDVVEPILGVQGSEETGGPALLDSVTTDAEWVLG
jgi:hypothetical protein